MVDGLDGIDVVGYRDRAAISREALDTLRNFNRLSTVPNARIDDNAGTDRITAWYKTLLREARIGSRFYCGTGLENFPFLECVVEDGRWLASLRSALGDNLDFIAGDERSVAMSFDDEYEILGFHRLL